LFPNPWNVNEMSPEMFQKELASISEFGFVVPLLVRPHPWEKDAYQIIDGEHRWRAGKELGMDAFPVSIIDVDDDTAQQLSIVLNETRGSSNQMKLASLVRSLASRTDPEKLQRIMPFSRERFDEMLERLDESRIDFDALKQKRQAMNGDSGWVERVFRLPADSATVVDDALRRIMEAEQIEEQWRALEMMAADSLAS
jgi:ParB-like chromosome segregation protein Spo0J